jgi:RND family efflux transporter MFP subunit
MKKMIPDDRQPQRGETEPETPVRPTSGKWLGFGALLALLAGLGLGAWGYQAQHKQVMAAAQQHDDYVPKLRVATIKPSDPTVAVTLPATTAAFAQANVFARASGYIDKRNVDIGDNVKAGDLLAHITAPEIEHQIQQAQASIGQSQAALQQAQANAELADVTWGRDKPLVQEGWVTKQQGSVDEQTLEAQQAAVGVAQQNLAAQQAQLKVLQQQQDYQSVVAPFDGTITQRNIDVGSLVQADSTIGTFMFTIMQSNVIRTFVHVPQDEAFGLEPGVHAKIRVPEIPGRDFPGTVTRVADALEPNTRTLLAEVDIPNPDGALSPGIYCAVELDIPRKVPSLTVPADAVVFNADGLRVAVFANGTAHFQKIAVTRDLGTAVEVSEGVRPGDQVILNPPVNLAEGDKVGVRPEAPVPTS